MESLFAMPSLPGLASAFELITPVEERSLIAAIDATAPTPFGFRGGWASD